MRQRHRHILITGASGGIGSAVALALADRSTKLNAGCARSVRALAGSSCGSVPR